MPNNIKAKLTDYFDGLSKTIETLTGIIIELEAVVKSKKESKSFWSDLLKPSLPNSNNYINAEKDGMSVRMSKGKALELIERLEKEERAADSYPRIFLNMAFIYLVSLFDAFIINTLLLIFCEKPETLKSKKNLTYEKAIELKEYNDLIRYIAEREVNELGYKSIKEQTEFLNQKFNLDLTDSGVSINDLSEIRAKRNLLVHNQGYVNNIFLDIVRNTQYQEGDLIEISFDYLEDTIIKLMKTASHLKDEVIKKFG